MLNSRKNQQGISLYVVIVIVLLSMLLALWSSRTALFNEMIVGNDADYQRAFYPVGVSRQMAAIVASGDRRKAVATITAPTGLKEAEADEAAGDAAVAATTVSPWAISFAVA